MSERILIGMSGGIDSTYLAWLLKSRGHDVIGVHLRLNPLSNSAINQPMDLSLNELPLETEPNGETEKDLIQKASKLGIELLFVELGSRFRQFVLEPFMGDYRAGITPNPCVVCNARVKFAALSILAERVGAGHYATGHYARATRHPTSGAKVISRSLDPRNDQSYFLCRLSSAALERAMMPLGDMRRDDVVAGALEEGLFRPSVKSSQDLCFAGTGGYTEILRSFGYGPEPGPIVDVELGEVGCHNGILNFTIGQRRGLSIALGSPRYVIEIDRATNTVVIGPENFVYRRALRADNLLWADGLEPEKPAPFNVQIRSRHKASPALVSPRPE
ncbi:MAG: hypothetical protein JW941_08840, partial [Candidatus Coatesbacteria bacterium]|nr:hypothetical protein [Candidatus Coatesbacteria bacterium]